MPIRLQMLQKPPVIFTRYAPSWVISSSELANTIYSSASRSEAISWLWFSYSRSILAEVDPCMEANEGAAATINLALVSPGLYRMNVSKTNDGCYELTIGEARLYLCETKAGDVLLYFFSPERHGNRCEECRIDLTDYGADAAAYFIATVFDSYKCIADYYEMNKRV